MNESSVHEFYFKNQPPTLSLLLVAFHNVPSHPDFKRITYTICWKSWALYTGSKKIKPLWLE